MKLTILFMIVGIMTFGLLIHLHENVHWVIYQNYNIDSHIEINFPDVETIPEGNFSNCNEYCTLAHHNNDVVGYNILPIFIILTVGLTIIIVIMELNLMK